LNFKQDEEGSMPIGGKASSGGGEKTKVVAKEAQGSTPHAQALAVLSRMLGGMELNEAAEVKFQGEAIILPEGMDEDEAIRVLP
jgi:hypothetical protein